MCSFGLVVVVVCVFEYVGGIVWVVEYGVFFEEMFFLFVEEFVIGGEWCELCGMFYCCGQQVIESEGFLYDVGGVFGFVCLVLGQLYCFVEDVCWQFVLKECQFGGWNSEVELYFVGVGEVVVGVYEVQVVVESVYEFSIEGVVVDCVDCWYWQCDDVFYESYEFGIEDCVIVFFGVFVWSLDLGEIEFVGEEFFIE